MGFRSKTKTTVDAIAHLGIVSQKTAHSMGKKLDVTVSVSSFVPKPHTPFQWEPQISEAEIRQHQNRIRDILRPHKIGFRYHNAGQTVLEGVISRGDRRVGDVIYAAYKLGCRLDAWDEHFKLDVWHEALKALSAHGLDWQWYHRRRALDEILPWDAVDSGADKKFLLKDLARAHKEASVLDCAWNKCLACSACDFKTLEPIVYPKDALRVSDPVPRPVRPTTTTMVRVRFRKEDSAVYLSHLELMYHLLRAFRRANVDVAYTQGFRPRPEISFSAALPFGTTSMCEFLDMEMYGEATAEALLEQLRVVSPTGVTFVEASIIAKDAPAIGNALGTMTFEAKVRDPGLIDRALAIYSSDAPLKIERLKDGSGRIFDVRSELADLNGVSSDTLSVTIRQRLDGTLRPDEVARALLADAPVVWKKTSVAFGTPDFSPSEVIKAPRVYQGKTSKFHKERRKERPRDDADLLKNAPFTE